MRTPWWMSLVLLGGCSGGGDDYNDAAQVPDDQAQAQAAIEQAAAQNGVARTARLGVPVASPTPTAARDRALPVDFQGYWGVTADDCELANVGATGRMNVDADTIRFYEARARVLSLARRSPFLVIADLRFSGEGGSGTRRTEFRLEAGGTALIRTERSPPLSVRYQKC